MKKIKLLGWALMALASFSACTNDAEEILAQENEIKLTSEITPSRVTNQELQSTQIVPGQKIGVTITGANAEHKNVAWSVGDNGALTNTGDAVYYGNGIATITAYHPYNPTWTETNHAFAVNSDQSTNEGYLASDLLWTKTTTAKTESPVALTFTHKLAKVNVTLTSEDIDDLSNATISICGTNISTDFNLDNGELSNSSNTQDIIAGITTTNAYTAAAIIVPQTIYSGTLLIKVNYNNKNFIYTLPADKTFESGHSYSYTLNIKEKLVEMEVESDNITDWNNEEITGDLAEEVIEKYVKVQVAGTLSDLITENEKYTITTLKVSGDINGDDVRFIREMAGYDADGIETAGKLINLDLSNANIVEGGGTFLNYGADFLGYDFDGNYKLGQWVEDIYTIANSTNYMFIGLKNMENIVLPSSLKSIDRNAFYGCQKLKNITIPQNVNSGVWYEMSFDGCLSLESINVEEGNELLFSKGGALYHNLNDVITLLAVPAALKTFTISSDVDDISWNAFLLGNSLEELVIQNGAAELKPYFYDKFYKLKNFVLENDNERYASVDGILYSKDLKVIECYPSGRTDTHFDIPNGTEEIGFGCFDTSLHLQTISIPEGVENIGGKAFFTCSNVHELVLPSSVKNIGEAAFQHLHLYQLTCKAVTPPTLYDEWVFAGTYDKIFVPKESVNLYKEAEIWNKFANVIYPIE